MKATKTTTRTEIKVKTDIRPRPASPAQKQVWKRLWQRLISEAKATQKEMPPNQAPAEDTLTGGTEEGVSL